MQRSKAILADDDPTSRSLVADTLDRLNYDVVAVTSSREVVTAVKAHKDALVLIAPSLPEPDAWEVCRELRAAPGYRYIICLLEHYSPGAVTAAFAAGADDAIAKPLIAGELMARLQHAKRVLALEESRRTLEDEGALLAELSTRASLHSHRYLHAQLTNEFARAQRFGHALALILAEVKCAPGSEPVMRAIGQWLPSICRSRIDWIARHSKHCFAIVLPETGLAGALQAATRVQTLLSDDTLLTTVGLKGLVVNLGISTLDPSGIASLPADGPRIFLDAAEAYLHDAAQKGPSRIAGGPTPHL